VRPIKDLERPAVVAASNHGHWRYRRNSCSSYRALEPSALTQREPLCAFSLLRAGSAEMPATYHRAPELISATTGEALSQKAAAFRRLILSDSYEVAYWHLCEAATVTEKVCFPG
jgi:hypothetical protein